MRSAIKRAESNTDFFRRGATPFFFGNSCETLIFGDVITDFEVGARPLLTVDNRLSRALLVPLSVRRDTPHLVESVRLLRHLQSDSVQRKIASLSYLPLSENNHDSPAIQMGFFPGGRRACVLPVAGGLLCGNQHHQRRALERCLVQEAGGGGPQGLPAVLPRLSGSENGQQ